MQDILQKAREFLGKLNKYNALIKETDPGFVFETLFAYFFEVEVIQLEYEVKINPPSEKTVDFLYRTQSGNSICFELHRPDSDDEIERSWQNISDPDSGQIYGCTVELSSTNSNKHLRPEAQTIRLQEKLLSKVDKFPPASNNVLSVIVANCQQIHFGYLDIEDVRMVMYGRTQNPAFQEWWNTRRIFGLCEVGNPNKDAPKFRDRVSAVIFVPGLTENFLDGVFIALNTARSIEHQEQCKKEISCLSPLSKLVWVT